MPKPSPTTLRTLFVSSSRPSIDKVPPLPASIFCRISSRLLHHHFHHGRPYSSSSLLRTLPRSLITPQRQLQLQRQRQLQFTRNMASTSTSAAASQKKEFLCIIPDKPGMVKRRMEVRPAHLEGVKPLVEKGVIVLGGGMFETHPTEGEETPPSFKGSAMIVVAETVDEVKAVLTGDIYATSGVWDVENASIVPFKSAVRLGM